MKTVAEAAMKDYSFIVLPFQIVLSVFIARIFRAIVPRQTYIVMLIAMTLDLIAITQEKIFPLASFFVIVAILRYYGKDWWSVLYAFAFNFFMYIVYAKVPMGAYFVTAANYYIAYTVMQTLTKNEFYIKNVLYYASLKHLTLAAGYWLANEDKFLYIVNGLSVVIAYFMIRASIYYHRMSYASKEDKQSN